MLVELQVIVFSELFGNKHKLCNNVPSVTMIITEKRSAVRTFICLIYFSTRFFFFCGNEI
jgi:hypothetical protein